MLTIFKDFSELVQHLKNISPKIITIDGRDGTGKTYLSVSLHEKLGGVLLSEKMFRSATLNERFAYDKIKILKTFAVALKSKPVIFESCFMQEILNDIGLKPDITIYIKTLSNTTNQWTDEDELAEELTKELAVKKEVDFGKSIGFAPSNFRLQMIEYHYDFKPHENADIVFERIEKFNSEPDIQ